MTFSICHQKHKQQKQKLTKGTASTSIQQKKQQNEKVTYGMGKKFANHILDKELTSKTYQELIQLKNKQTKNKRIQFKNE